MVYRWTELAQSCLNPPLCLACGAAGQADLDLCPACCADLPWLGPACPTCAQPGPVARTCTGCQRRPPPQTTSHALFRYGFPVDRLIAALKFGHDLAHARLLGSLLLLARPHLAPTDLVLPVPLHPQRLARRGFNQAVEIARPLARALGLDLGLSLATRVRDTPAQARADRRTRRRNLAGAFRISAHPPPRVLIVDDVMTTGATVAALARALRQAGTREVRVLVVARTV